MNVYMHLCVSVPLYGITTIETNYTLVVLYNHH